MTFVHIPSGVRKHFQLSKYANYGQFRITLSLKIARYVRYNGFLFQHLLQLFLKKNFFVFFVSTSFTTTCILEKKNFFVFFGSTSFTTIFEKTFFKLFSKALIQPGRHIDRRSIQDGVGRGAKDRGQTFATG
jgi:hypothetical protein